MLFRSEADTVGFYFRGDEDARFTLGIFRDAKGALKPLGVGFYPKKPTGLKGRIRQQSYKTPVGEASFAHVGPIEGAAYGFAVDKDGKGFVLAASIPVDALPFVRAGERARGAAAGRKIAAGWRTRVNFDANLGGHNRFWWANTDGSASIDTYDEPSEARIYPGSWAQATFAGFEGGLVLNNWMHLGPFGGPGAEKFTRDPRNKKDVEKFFFAAKFSPDGADYDPDRVYSGPETAGYWGGPKNLKWVRAEMGDLDCRAVFAKGGAQCCYGTTFISSPKECEVTLELYNHAQTFLDWSLNGEPLKVPDKAYRNDERKRYRRITEVKVKLRKGLNELRFRGFCEGYSPMRAGAVVRAPEETLWSLGTSIPVSKVAWKK